MFIFNSEYCKVFDERLRKSASENLFNKLRKIKNYS